MEVDQVSTKAGGVNSGTKQFSDLDILYRRKSYFAPDIFEPSDETLDMIGEANVLVIGAGGLGCEILKDLALSGIK